MANNIADLLVGIQGLNPEDSVPSTPVSSSPFTDKLRPFKNMLSLSRTTSSSLQKEISFDSVTDHTLSDALSERTETSEAVDPGFKDEQTLSRTQSDDLLDSDAADVNTTISPKRTPTSSPPLSPALKGMLGSPHSYSEEDIDQKAPHLDLSFSGDIDGHNRTLIVDEETIARMEADVIFLLKEIAVYGCKMRGYGVVDDLLVSLSRLEGRGLSRFHIQG